MEPFKKSRHIKAKVAAGFSLSFLLLVTAGIITFTSLRDLSGNVKTLAEPDRKLSKIKEILIGISRAESSIRAYTLSGNDRALQPYYDFLFSIEENIDTLYRLTPHDSYQRQLVDSLAFTLSQKLEIFSIMVKSGGETPESVSENLLKRIIDHRPATAISPEAAAREQATPPAQPEKKKPFLKRIFRAKGKEDVQPQGNRREQSKAPEGLNPQQLKEYLKQAQQEEFRQQQQLQQEELTLLQRDIFLMGKIYQIAGMFEAQERQAREMQHAKAEEVVERGILILGTILFTSLALLVLFVYIVFADITRSYRYKQELFVARKEAEHLARLKEQLLANMSHEIRTPLNAILGFTEQLDKTPLDQKQKKFLSAVQKSSDLLLNTVNDILNFSKIEAGRLPLESVPFSLKEVIADTVETLSLQAREKAITLQYQMEDGLDRTFVGDPFRLKQVLINLTGNGIKFTSEGSVEIIAGKLEDTPGGTVVKIEVRDTGVGIPEDQLASIFEEFTQADSTITRRFGGTGLGLTIVKKIVELMNGTVSVNSEVGKGSVFTVILPLQHAVPGEAEIDDKGGVTIDTGKIKGLRVLLVDDDELNLLLGKTILDSWKVETTVAENGTEALTRIREKEYDVVLMDYHMPQMSGVEATRVIRKMNPPASQVPVIAVTANIVKEEIDKCLDAGMDDFLFKPFKEKELYQKILAVVARKKHEMPSSGASTGVPPNADDTSVRNANSLYSLSRVKQTAGDDSKFLVNVLETFVRTTYEGTRKLKDSVVKEDYQQAGQAAHKLISSFSHLGVDSVIGDLRELELLSSGQGDKYKAPAAAARVASITNTVNEQLLAEIERLKTENSPSL